LIYNGSERDDRLFCDAVKITAQLLDEIFPILIIKKDAGSGDPSDNDILQQAVIVLLALNT